MGEIIRYFKGLLEIWVLLGKDLLSADDKKDEMICDLGEILYPTQTSLS